MINIQIRHWIALFSFSAKIANLPVTFSLSVKNVKGHGRPRPDIKTFSFVEKKRFCQKKVRASRAQRSSLLGLCQGAAELHMSEAKVKRPLSARSAKWPRSAKSSSALTRCVGRHPTRPATVCRRALARAKINRNSILVVMAYRSSREKIFPFQGPFFRLGIIDASIASALGLSKTVSEQR